MSSLVRKTKRHMKRQAIKRPMSDFYAKLDKTSELVDIELKARQDRALENFYDTEVREFTNSMSLAMYYQFGLQLHKLFGFGAKRLARLFQAVDASMEEFQQMTFADKQSFNRALAQQLYDETGIDYRT